jgi:16S rRNA (cytosine967-C5)-methyltransferase
LIEIQHLASTAVAQVLAGRNLNQVLSGLWSRHPSLTAQQRAATQDISYGTLRFLGRLEVVLGQLMQKPMHDEAVHSLLLVALYQLQYSKAAEHAVVDHAVKTVLVLKKPWAKGLVNAVLRNFLRQRSTLLEKAAADDEGRYSHPQWWVDKLRQQYPADWEAMLAANNQHPPMTLRVNRRRLAVDSYLEQLREQGMAARSIGAEAIMLEHPVGVDKLPGFGAGLVSVQDAGAQQAARLLDVADGMRVLDACAAPGGKAAHLLETAVLDLTALDNDPERLQKIGQTLQRLGLEANCVVGDAAQPDAWWDGRPYQRILADVPCSASGVVRRHPDIKWLRRAEDIAGFAAQQAQILEALWRVLESGGKLLYATCSVFAEENQQQIASFLARHPEARCLSPDLPGARDGQLIPNAEHDGFYYALLSKT